MAKITTKYDQVIAHFANQAGVDPYLLKGLLFQESSLNPKAKSKTGVVGLAQVTRATAKDPGVGLRTLDGRPVAPLHDVNDDFESVRFAADYLSAMLKRFDGNEEFATTAYNEGPFGKVYKAFKEHKSTGIDPAVALKKAGVDKDASEYFGKIKGHTEKFRAEQTMELKGTPTSSVGQGGSAALLAQNEDVDYMALQRDQEMANRGLLRDPIEGPGPSRKLMQQLDTDIERMDIRDKVNDQFGDSPNKDAALKAEMDAMDAPTFDEPEEVYEAPEGEYILGSAGEGLVKPGEYDEYAPDPGRDPMFRHLEGTETASPAEEKQYARVVDGAAKDMFGDKILPKAIRHLRAGAPAAGADTSNIRYDSAETGEDYHDRGEASEQTAELAFLVMSKQYQKEKQKGHVFPSVFFSETGAAPTIFDMGWKLGQKLGLAGYDDQRQYMKGMILLYKKMADHIIERGDEDAIEEAEELNVAMAMTREDGSEIESVDYARGVEYQQIERNSLSNAIGTVLQSQGGAPGMLG